MKTRSSNSQFFGSCLLVAAAACLIGTHKGLAEGAPKTKMVIIAGPSTHPPGTHEVAAGARLMEYCLKNAENAGPIAAEMFTAWPDDPAVLEDVATLVFIGDIFPPVMMEQPATIMAQVAKLMDEGCGIVCVHYATGLRGPHVAENGDHPLLHWLGGYFATGGCTHHRSTARVVTSTLTPEDNQHPILRGWRSFTFDDEPYWNNYFGEGGMRPNVTPLVYAMLPPDKPQKETVAWAVEREDGGRGVGIVVPHYFKSWQIDDLRTLVLNCIVWSAKLDIPSDGVKASLPDLAKFQPDAVDPQPRRKKKP